MSTQDTARDRVRSQIVQCNVEPAGNKHHSCPNLICKGDLLSTQEKVTMQTKIMLTLTVVVVAFACAALAGGNGIRDNRYTSTAQYCMPQVDDDADAFRVYC